MKIGDKVKVISVLSPEGSQMWDKELIGKTGVIANIEEVVTFEDIPIVVLMDDEEFQAGVKAHHSFWPDMLEVVVDEDIPTADDVLSGVVDQICSGLADRVEEKIKKESGRIVLAMEGKFETKKKSRPIKIAAVITYKLGE